MEANLFAMQACFISNTRPKLAKNKQSLSNTLWLNFYLKIIHFLHSFFKNYISGYWDNKDNKKRYAFYQSRWFAPP